MYRGEGWSALYRMGSDNIKGFIILHWENVLKIFLYLIIIYFLFYRINKMYYSVLKYISNIILKI